MNFLQHTMHVFLASCILLVGCVQQQQSFPASDTYSFPLHPGMQEWKNLANRTDMLAAVQIPDQTLQAISTAGLIETVVAYPLKIDLFVYSSLQLGITHLKQDFNGLNALLSRPDAAMLLFEKYQSLIDSSEPLELIYLEMILAQPELIDQFTVKQRQSILTTALHIYNQRDELVDVYSSSSLESITLLAGRILDDEAAFDALDPRVKQFLQHTTYNDDYDMLAVEHIVFDTAEQYIATFE